jgi:two-component system sensor histidine kinase/response regulator
MAVMTSTSTHTVPRLFIVDDEPALMTALCSTLRGEGYDTVGFTSAGAALTALLDARCDLLLTDLRMPEMDGIDMLRAAQRIDPSLVGVVMTGAGSVASAVEAMKAGALDFILKPFNLSAILPVLSRALEVRRLRLLNEELQQRLRRRTIELEAANKELASYSQSISHDLRAPLRSLGALCEVTVREHSLDLSTEVLRRLNAMQSSAQRMERLVEDLLRLSSLGRQALQVVPVDVEELVADVVRELRQAQPDRVVDVRIGSLLPVQADPLLLRQVYVNLLSNAFKFTRHQAQAVVEVGAHQQDGVPVYFVRDNGTGFDMARASRLFEAFQRLHSSAEFEGTGIGLSIVQRIVERHGGRIWTDSQVDHGATFQFTLPADLE